MDKKQLDKERAKLLKEVRAYLKAIDSKAKLKVDKHDDYPCVIIGNYVHISKEFDEKGRYSYYVYYITSFMGSYEEPPWSEPEAIPYHDEHKDYGEGWFANLNDAFVGAMRFYTEGMVSQYDEHLAQVAEDKYWASLSDKEKEELGY